MKLARGYVQAFADAIERVNTRRTRAPEAAVLVMHPHVMRSLIQEMQASGEYDKLDVPRRPPNAFMGVVTMVDADASQPFLTDIHGAVFII